ncbi:TPA: recombination mediator protein UvsY, partial [Candidatus Woesearchaeota archaeon]|nr:recombination mediator protein UvsY [Candidatus Woesearchaeota archaeon]
FMDEKLKLAKLESECKILIRLKWEYYTGKLSMEELDELGWQPFQKKILRGDLDKYLDSDSELIAKNHCLIFQEEKVKYLDVIVKSFNSRHWKIRNAIEWRKFVSGVS